MLPFSQKEPGVTPRDVVFREGTARLLRFRRPIDVIGPAGARQPVLLVPSMINRWYIMDLREKASLAAALARAGLDTFCLDWGIAEDEDRYLGWDDVVARVHRMVRVVKRKTGAKKIGVLGYCMGGTLSGIATALRPDDVGALVNLLGPFDFSQAGVLGTLVSKEWFDARAIAEAGNVSPSQMQSGFVALRPTAQLGKVWTLLERGHDPDAREAFETLEGWAQDNIPFPGAAYETYIKDLYQGNLLVKGLHHVAGERVDLADIRCPVLTVAADRDAICPLAAAKGLNDHCGSEDNELLVASGGHVGAVIGSKAPKVLYPAIAKFFITKLGPLADERGQEARWS